VLLTVRALEFNAFVLRVRYMYRVDQKGPFLKVTNSCSWWHSKAFRRLYQRAQFWPTL